MTTIRNNAVLPSANPILSSPLENTSSASASQSPFAAFLQQHVAADGAARSSLPSQQTTPQTQAQQQAAAQRLRDQNRDSVRDPARDPMAQRTANASTNQPAAQQADRSGDHADDNTVNKQPANGSGSNGKAGKSEASAKPGNAKAGDKSAQSDKADKANKTADDDAAQDAQAAAADPMAAWLATLQGGAQAADKPAVAADAAAGTDAAGHAVKAARGRGESLVQVTETQTLGAPGSSAASKADDAGNFAAALAGHGRAGDAAGGNELGLAAVRMLNGGDATALQGLGQHGAAESVGAASIDASAQLAAMGGLNGLSGAASSHGADTTTIVTPVGSPGFANELADQVQVMVSKAALDAAAGSVHEARLNLNPAEMGPIAVRISLDGNQAHVDFAAASDATRQALEGSMPALASALHGAGLTLSGGGVSQEFAQARQDQAQQSASGSGRSPRGSNARDDQGAVQGVTTSASNWIRRPEGNVDLYA